MENNLITEKISQQILDGFWPGYVYCYPHKRAYRPIPNMNMGKIWPDGIDELNLYLHIPFCDRKCAFCNLFSMAMDGNNHEDYYNSYIDALFREIDFYKEYIHNPKIVSLFYGGGTPNVLSIKQLERIQNKLKETFSIWDPNVEACIECSPDRLDREYIKELKRIGFRRVSMGVQSFNSEELNLINRNYSNSYVYEAYAALKEEGFNINIDLIYGLPKQTVSTLEKNLEEVVRLAPETITAYPLAIRELTGIEQVNKEDLFSMQEKYNFFDHIRNFFEESGYICQTNLRFAKSDSYTYQQEVLEFKEIPTLGLGAGGRSYSPNTHYCLPYKIQKKYVKSIIDDYLKCDFKTAIYDGYFLNVDENKRKHIMYALLGSGLNKTLYNYLFKEPLEKQFLNEFKALLENELIESKDGVLYMLTKKGRKYCDIAVYIFESEEAKNNFKTFSLE